MTSTLSKFGVPLASGRGGIVQPMQAYRFRVIPLTRNVGISFSQNVDKVDINMKEKTFTIVARQTILPDFMYDLETIINNCREWRVDFLDGGNEAAHYAINFKKCTLKNHECGLSYADNGYVKHVLTYSYDYFLILTDEEETDTQEPSKEEGFLTPTEAVELLNKEKDK